MSDLDDILAELKEEGVFGVETPVVSAPAIEVPKPKIILPPIIEEIEEFEAAPLLDSEELSDEDIIETKEINFEEKTLEFFNKIYVAVGRLSDKVDRLAGVMRNPIQEQIAHNGIHAQVPQPPPFPGDPNGRSPAELIGTQIYRGKDAWKNVVTLGREEAPVGVANGADAAFAALEYLEPTQPVQPLDYGMSIPRRGPPTPQAAFRQQPSPMVVQPRLGSSPVPSSAEAFDFLSDL